jgi:hypothetical protein
MTRDPRVWRLRGRNGDDWEEVVEFGLPGDRLERGGREGDWRAMRLELARRRRLIVALLGDGLYLVPETAVSRLPTLVQMAREAADE